MSVDGEQAGGQATRPNRKRLALVVAPIVGLVIAGYIGDALTTTWAEKHPLWLVLLNARSRILVLTTNQLDPVSFYLVAGLRLLASDPLFYLLGRWYGDAMIERIERKSKTFGEQIRLYERAFSKAAYPLIFLMPNPYICVFAGASGMRVGAFFAANIAGTITRLYMIRRVGEAFDEPIQGLLGFFARYRLPLFVVSVALLVVVLLSDRRSEGKGEISSMLDLAGNEPEKPTGAVEAVDTEPERRAED